MANTIHYDVAKFPAQLPNGLTSPASGYHATTMARLVWAATTVGTTPFGPRLRHSRALEFQWRAAMMRASIQPRRGGFGCSESYARLDPSEKGAVSFFLGQAQAKLFAHDFFRISRLVSYDSYLAHLGRLRRRTRPDFIGFRSGHAAIGLEAKGRSPNGFRPGLVARAKKQASSLPTVDGHPLTATYAHVAYFDRGQWCAHLEDPPPARQQDNVVDPAALTLAYYLPLLDALRARQTEMVSLDGEFSYLSAYLAEIDAYLSVRADIAALVPPDMVGASMDTNDFRSVGDAFYDLVLAFDQTSAQAPGPESLDTEHVFLGDDGVAIELGSTWVSWADGDG